MPKMSTPTVDINIDYQESIDVSLELKQGLEALVLRKIDFSNVEGVPAHVESEDIYSSLKDGMSLYRQRVENDAENIRDIAWEFNLTDMDLSEYFG